MKEGDWTLGLSASALSGLSSAYAGVYFEKYVKGKMSSTLWIRNLQLGIYGLPLSIAYMYAKDHANLSNGGVMQVIAPCRVALRWVQLGCSCSVVLFQADHVALHFVVVQQETPCVDTASHFTGLSDHTLTAVCHSGSICCLNQKLTYHSAPAQELATTCDYLLAMACSAS